MEQSANAMLATTTRESRPALPATIPAWPVLTAQVVLIVRPPISVQVYQDSARATQATSTRVLECVRLARQPLLDALPAAQLLYVPPAIQPTTSN